VGCGLALGVVVVLVIFFSFGGGSWFSDAPELLVRACAAPVFSFSTRGVSGRV